mmetsp:Transcript_8075/g.20255  ORF Transcript_8075/g.20255 Transcript_8075/m.20255 type:complete len:557 (+) Transcript_8075:262-1932(+)
MGNQPMTGRKSDNNTFALHDNLITEDSKAGEKYSLEHGTIGKGQTSQNKIVKGTLKKYTKTGHSAGVAIKLYDGSSQLPADLRAEASILSQCDHPNIVKLFEVTKIEGKMSLVLELCSGGNVLSRIPYKESQVSNIIRQVTSAISYMHSNHLMHRDIECSNIMFATPDEDSDVKLVDFGSAVELQMVPGHEGAFKFLKDRTGSMYVMAPEVIRGKYGPKADVWSIGVVAYTLLMVGKHPIEGKNEDEFERKILQGSVDYRNWQYSKDAKDFCQETMMINAGFRLSASSALIHPWMNFGKKDEDKKKTLPVELVTSFNLYRIAPPLKRIALNALALKSTSSMYDSIFERLNKSNSGILSKEEVVEGFKYSGNSEEELDDLFEKLVRLVIHSPLGSLLWYVIPLFSVSQFLLAIYIYFDDQDINNNGGVTYTEFMAASLEAQGELEESSLREAFDIISSNGRYITKKDVADVVSESVKRRNDLEKVKHKIEIQMNKFKMNHKKDKIHFDDFCQLFEHGFDAQRSMDAIIETSLNEEQLNQMKEDDRIKHLVAIKEAED